MDDMHINFLEIEISLNLELTLFINQSININTTRVYTSICLMQFSTGPLHHVFYTGNCDEK